MIQSCKFKPRNIGMAMLLLLLTLNGLAQTDTIKPASGRLKLSIPTKSTYAVYFTDTTGNRTTTADLWDRSLNFATNQDSGKTVSWEWKWYRHDSLASHAIATVNATTLLPFQYQNFRQEKVFRTVSYHGKKAMTNGKSKFTGLDTAYTITLTVDAFPFPMDLEVFGALPIKAKGQRFVIPFYEPGTSSTGWYTYTVQGSTELELAKGLTIACWLLRSEDDTPGNYQLFYIAKKSGEVLKMEQRFNSIFRYKVKLY